MLTQSVLISVSGNDADEILKKKLALQDITNAADLETHTVMGEIARKPGALAKIKSYAQMPFIKGLAKRM